MVNVGVAIRFLYKECKSSSSVWLQRISNSAFKHLSKLTVCLVLLLVKKSLFVGHMYCLYVRFSICTRFYHNSTDVYLLWMPYVKEIHLVEDCSLIPIIQLLWLCPLTTLWPADWTTSATQGPLPHVPLGAPPSDPAPLYPLKGM